MAGGNRHAAERCLVGDDCFLTRLEMVERAADPYLCTQQTPSTPVFFGKGRKQSRGADFEGLRICLGMQELKTRLFERDAKSGNAASSRLVRWILGWSIASIPTSAITPYTVSTLRLQPLSGPKLGQPAALHFA